MLLSIILFNHTEISVGNVVHMKITYTSNFVTNASLLDLSLIQCGKAVIQIVDLA